jgi:hypothetical protein
MMELSIIERLVLLNILPKEGNFLTLKLIRQLRESLSFDEAEIKAVNLRQVDEKVAWDMDKAVPKKIEIGEKMSDLVVGTLKDLDKEGKLKDEHFSLFEKFVEI